MSECVSVGDRYDIDIALLELGMEGSLLTESKTSICCGILNTGESAELLTISSIRLTVSLVDDKGGHLVRRLVDFARADRHFVHVSEEAEDSFTFPTCLLSRRFGSGAAVLL